jgi:hypothetical protein
LFHPNSNRGTENNGQNNFDANGNLLNLDNIGNLDWHYNNTLCVIFAAFAQNVGADVQGATLLFCFVG